MEKGIEIKRGREREREKTVSLLATNLFQRSNNEIGSDARQSDGLLPAGSIAVLHFKFPVQEAECLLRNVYHAEREMISYQMLQTHTHEIARLCKLQGFK